MKVPGVRTLGNLPRVMDAKAAACGNGNTVRSAFHKAREHRRTGDHVGSASGGENAMATSGNHIFQSLAEIGRCIEGAVKGDLEGMGQSHQGASAFNIDGAIAEEHAENSAGSANTANVFNLLAHAREGGGIVIKAIRMGANHYVNRNPAVIDCPFDQRARRREAVPLERGAEFNAIGAAHLRSEARLHRFSTQFEYHQIAPGSFPCSVVPNATLVPAAQSSLTVTNAISRLRRSKIHGTALYFAPCCFRSHVGAGRLNSRSSGRENAMQNGGITKAHSALM